MSDTNFEVYLSFNALGGGFMQSFLTRFRDSILEIFEKEAAAEGADATLAQITAAVSPEVCSAEAYQSRLPYTKPEFLKESFQGAVERGWITLEGDDFKATKKAVALNNQLVQLLLEKFNPLDELVSVDIDEVVKRLNTVVGTAEEVPLPLKPTFQFGRNFEYEDKTPSLAWVRRQLLTIGGFRDDCHLSAWQKHKLPGYHWETFSFIWEGETNTAEKLAETLSGYRGYQQAEYQSAIEQLIEKGWAEAKEDHYIVTEIGRQLRAEAEELTNQYYVKAFSALSEAELIELNGMIEKMTTELAQKSEKKK